MKQFNGKFSCSMCLEEGACLPGKPLSRFYPFKDLVLERTHQSMLQDAREACRKKEAVNGVKGVSAVMSLRYADLPKMFVIDWMHNVLLGVTKSLMTYWLSSAHKDKEFFIGNKIALLNQRLMKIQIPDFISRRQRCLEEYGHWKASEYREWLIHFSVPVLGGVLKPYFLVHFSLLVTAMSLLTKDVISPEDVNTAEQLLYDFCRLFPAIYGLTSQTMNVHLLRHITNFTRLHGPLFCSSCFGFESMNSFIKKMVHGTRHINRQISFAVSMSKYLPTLLRKHLQEADSNMEMLANRLGLKFLIENERFKPMQVSILGKEKSLQRDDPAFVLLTADMQGKQISSFLRIQMPDAIYHSKAYKLAKTRNNYTISYQLGNLEEYGIILIFINVGTELFAVVNQYNVVPFSFDGETKDELKSTDLRDQLSRKLCPHIQRVEGFKEKKIKLVSVKQIRRKCVFININHQYQFISKPPNVLEHG